MGQQKDIEFKQKQNKFRCRVEKTLNCDLFGIEEEEK